MRGPGQRRVARPPSRNEREFDMKKKLLAAALCLLTGVGGLARAQDPGSLFNDDGTYNRPTMIWGGAEYLLWWTKNNSLGTPIVSTTNNPNATVNGVNVAAGLGQAGTSVLIGDGGQGIDYGALSGGRFTF